MRRRASTKRKRAEGAVRNVSERDVDDSAVDAVATLLRIYGRGAFDTDLAAADEIDGRCAQWVTRILSGDVQLPKQETAASGAELVRDWKGLRLFFAHQRRDESQYVIRSLGSMRHAIRDFSRCMRDAVRQEMRTDAGTEAQVVALEGALEARDPRRIFEEATALADTTRAALAARREREVARLWTIRESMSQLREELARARGEWKHDELTQLYDQAAYREQVEHLATVGWALGDSVWVVHVTIDAFESLTEDARQAALRALADGMSRTFLRKEDFLCRTGDATLALLSTEVKSSELSRMFVRLQTNLDTGASADDGSPPSLSIGGARLRFGDEQHEWLERCDAALAQATPAGTVLLDE